MEHPFRGQGPVLFLLVPYLAGFFGGLLAGPALPAAAALCALAAVAAAALRARPLATASAVALFCGLLAAARVPSVEPEAVRPFLDEEVAVSAVVEEAHPTDEGTGGVASGAVVSTLDGARRIRLARIAFSVRNLDEAIPAGSGIRATGRLRPCRGRGNPGEFPRELAALAQGVQYGLSSDRGRAIASPAPAGGRFSPDVFRRARERIRAWLTRAAGRSDGALYLLALAVGDVPPPSHPMVVLLRRTGLAHLLAISGINVVIFHMIVSGAFRLALWAVRMRRGTPDLARLSALLALPASWAYTLVSGAPVSALRSAGMLSVGVAIWCRFGAAGAGLAWTALFVATTVVSPALVVSPSFLLSYAASFFLIVHFHKRPARSPGAAGAAMRKFREALGASSVAFLGTLPLSAAFFSHVPAGAIAWNLLFAPVLGTAGVAGAVAAVFGGAFSIDALAGPVVLAARGLSAAIGLLDRVSLSGWGYAAIPPAGLGAAILCTGAAAAGSVALLRRGRPAWPAVAGSAAAFLFWAHLPYLALPDHRLRVTALNVGRGAAHVVSFPGGGHAVIDCGSAMHGDSGRCVVAPFLRSRGVKKIDVLVLTHPHEDHYGGAAALFEEFEVGEIWIPAGTAPEAFGEAVARKSALVRPRKAGDLFERGGAVLEVRGGGSGGGPRTVNEESLVLELRHGVVSFRLPGDVESGPSAWGRKAVRDARTILFLPHHGSSRADPAGWIRASRPELVVSQNSDCSGAENLLPSLKSIPLENGAFTIRSDGRDWSMERALGPPLLRCMLRF